MYITFHFEKFKMAHFCSNRLFKIAKKNKLKTFHFIIEGQFLVTANQHFCMYGLMGQIPFFFLFVNELFYKFDWDELKKICIFYLS